MNSDPGEGTSDGRKERSRKYALDSYDEDLTIKQEDEIKEEPTDRSEMIVYPRAMPTIILYSVDTESESDDDGQLNNDSNADYVKEEIKCEEEQGIAKEKCDGDDNEQANGVDIGDQGNGQANIPSTNSNNNRKRPMSNARGRNRVLTQKRNMAKGSKTRRVQTKHKKVHECQQCSYTTCFKYCLTVHIRTHTGEKPFECQICGKSFAQKQHFNGHKKIHRSQFAFHCSKCRIGFEQETDKVNHEDKCRRRQYECHLCQYSTLHLSSLKRHMRVHHIGDKPFKCSVCTKRCSTKAHLSQHSRVHVEELPFECSKCGQRFANGNGKQSHEERCNRRRFECYLCRYKCFHKSNLEYHMQSHHTGEKPFKCAICQKKFFQKGYLNRHLATYTKW